MIEFSNRAYASAFQRLTQLQPFEYQVEVARALYAGKSIVLRAPTGAGKTWSVIAPFLGDFWRCGRPNRLIYALPLRTLAQGVYRQAREAAQELGNPVDPVTDSNGREITPPFVTLQTGEQPDDPFFDRGRIIVTTYDQLLSGLLDGPYGLSDRLHNINAAAIAGALIVFDEFHLMPVEKAFLTAAAGLHVFRDLCQSVWMTATATGPLEGILRESLGTLTIPQTAAERQQLNNSLPSVRDVVRNLCVENTQLEIDPVLRFAEGRSIVLANTVSRAQAIYEGIVRELTRRSADTPVFLLHSRFFKEDRRDKEAKLRSLFGPGTRGSAVLVATQVIEAGLDISCDHLHTELCPMNSLVQRAGRCARFPNERGTVHVYRLPDQARNWLPYGDLHSEDEALSRTRELLTQVSSKVLLSPETTAQWVEHVHANGDASALRSGFFPRVNECLGRIHRKAILRDNDVGVADLIRGGESDSVRVLVAHPVNRPDTPAQRESIGLSRWSLAAHLDGARDIGFFWSTGPDEPEWKPLRYRDELRRTYAVCLRPDFARYTKEVGLILGSAGNNESPRRHPPRRPGYAPLHEETWVHHARCVADEMRRRLNRECPPDVSLSTGLRRRYGLTLAALKEASDVCALLHDLGKLQLQWQLWATAAMQAKDGSYRYAEPLAHTDYDPEDPNDRAREREVLKNTSRPAHAPASAFYAMGIIAKLLPSVAEGVRKEVASACLAAILAHHGGWLPDREKLDRSTRALSDGWHIAISQAVERDVESKLVLYLTKQADKYGLLSQILSLASDGDALAEWWPLTSFLTRTLRLSDQRATAEGHNHE